MMASAYAKLIYMPRPVSNRRKMDVGHRAKQFAPFAALRGFEESVRKKEILYEPRKELSEEKKQELDGKLKILSADMWIHGARDSSPDWRYGDTNFRYYRSVWKCV